jgi:hypothetical protein
LRELRFDLALGIGVAFDLGAIRNARPGLSLVHAAHFPRGLVDPLAEFGTTLVAGEIEVGVANLGRVARLWRGSEGRRRHRNEGESGGDGCDCGDCSLLAHFHSPSGVLAGLFRESEPAR